VKSLKAWSKKSKKSKAARRGVKGVKEVKGVKGVKEVKEVKEVKKFDQKRLFNLKNSPILTNKTLQLKELSHLTKQGL
jgi:hypothetical protein